MVTKPPKLPEKVLSAIEEGALVNATSHGGKSEAGAVIGRILAEFPDLRKDAGSVSAAVAAMVSTVNAMPQSEQEKLLRTRYPEAGKKTPKEGRVGLPPLPDAVKGTAAFRLPPEPSGFMTIGHAMAFTINYLYRVEYDGTLWLRFEDTNPRKVAKRYYESFRTGIKWLGISWDHEKNVSDDMEAMYDGGEKLLREGRAYACSCDAAKVKQLRFEGKACEHRDWGPDKNLKIWGELLHKKHKEGTYVIRFKGDMGNVNYSLRDPNLFRVIDHSHPLVGDKYSLWPTYDIANAIEDEICKITHVLRSSEFRNELQQLIRDALGLRKLNVIQFSRFNFKGTPVGKRLLRPLVEQNLVSGWDDPRMPTVAGVERRGIVPQAIRDFTLQVGYTKTEHEYDWSILMSINRKLLDPVSRRLFFVPDPVQLEIAEGPTKKVSIPYHPQSKLGARELSVSDALMVSAADLKNLTEGQTFRLMDLYNVQLTRKGEHPIAKYVGDELIADTRKLQWTPTPGVSTRVLAPGPLFNENGEFNGDSLKTVDGVCEESVSFVKQGEIVQFPRFGFCRLDSSGTFILSS